MATKKRKRRSSGPCVFLRGGRYWARLGAYKDVLPRTRNGKAKDVEPLKVKGEKLATTNETIALQLLAARVKELEEARLRGIMLGTSEAHTFKEIALGDLKDKAKRGDITEKWGDKLQKYVEAACDYFGDRDIQTIRPRDVSAFLDWLRETKAGRKGEALAGSTLRHYFHAVSSAFDFAVSQDLLPGNPARMLDRKRRPRNDTPDQPWFEMHDAALFLEAARLHSRPKGSAPTAYPFVYPLVATFLLTGGRKSEVLGLAVSDVDFERNIVHIRPHPWRRLKNRYSERAIPLWPQLREILHAYLKGPHAPKGEMLFPGEGRNGMIVDLRKTLDALAELCGWPKGSVSPKRARHGYASARVHTAGGDAIFNVAREMGHGSLAMITQVYAHAFPTGTTYKPTFDALELRAENHAKELKEALASLSDRVALQEC